MEPMDRVDADDDARRDAVRDRGDRTGDRSRPVLREVTQPETTSQRAAAPLWGCVREIGLRCDGGTSSLSLLG